MHCTARVRAGMHCMAVVVAAVALILVASGSLVAGALPPDGEISKWSQPPDLDNGRDIFSYWPESQNSPMFAVADDWRSLDNLPVTDIHWWGSYPNSKPAVAPGVLSFELSIHADIPAADNIPSRPGTLLWSNDYLLGPEVVETFFGTDNNFEDVYQYDLLLPQQDWFAPVAGQIYWLDVIARTTSPGVTWGWHTATRPGPDNGLDAAVMMLDYAPVIGEVSYTTWGPLYDFCHVQMAFELTTVPEPGTFALVGTMALGGLAILRRRRMK